MRSSSRLVLTLVRTGVQQLTIRSSGPRQQISSCFGLGRREFCSSGKPSQEQKSIVRAATVWERSQSYRSIIFAVAVSGCFGGLFVVLADAGSVREFDLLHADQSSVPTEPKERKKNVVVLGTGWGGTSFLKGLDGTKCNVQVVSPRNYFLFTPLLPSVTCGTVEARSITEPIRKMIKNQGKQVAFFEAECIKIDAAKKQIHCKDMSAVSVKGKEEFVLDFDYLVIAVGGNVNTFGTPGVKEHCHFLKEINDAERIRESVVDCFETATLPHLTLEEKKHMLSFVIVGGGPTGVEFAAELHDLIHEDLSKLYPDVKNLVSVTVIQAGDHILNTFDERISQYAEQKFQRDGVAVKTGCRVLAVNDGSVSVKEKATGTTVSVPFSLCVWSTGLGTQPVVSNFMEQVGQADRRMLATDEWLRVKGCDSIFALGDCATIEQRRVMEDISELFTLADKDKSGTLSYEEFQETMNLVRARYPQIDIYLQRERIRNIVDLVRESVPSQNQKSMQLNLDQFRTALCKIDSQMRAVPATAQVAAQQGAYLAKCFNQLCEESSKMEPEGPMRVRGHGRHRFQPFRYQHLGQFAPLGGEQAAAQLPGDWVSIGHSTQWLWYSVYASKQVSWRTRALVIFDWTKRLIFGRDSSRM